MRFVILLVTLALSACLPAARRLDTQSAPVDAASAATLISQYRVARGLPPVSVDRGLNRMAAAQAEANAAAGQLSHDAGGSFSARLASFGAANRGAAAENLAAGARSLEDVIAQWKASPGHNKNLLLPEATQIGIARVDAPRSRYKTFWALVLTATPRT